MQMEASNAGLACTKEDADAACAKKNIAATVKKTAAESTELPCVESENVKPACEIKGNAENHTADNANDAVIEETKSACINKAEAMADKAPNESAVPIESVKTDNKEEPEGKIIVAGTKEEPAEEKKQIGTATSASEENAEEGKKVEQVEECQATEDDECTKLVFAKAAEPNNDPANLAPNSVPMSPCTREQEEQKMAYWNIRGFIEPIRMIMEYLHLRYSDIEYNINFLQPITVPEDQWKRIKECLESGLTMTTSLKGIGHIPVSHTVGICRHLAQRYRPKMVGSAMNEFAEIDSVLYLCHDIRKALIEAHENGWEQSKETAMKFINEKLCFVNKFLKYRKWISGKQASVADFVFAELLEFLQVFDATAIDMHQNCRKLLRKLYAIPEISKYKEAQTDFDIAKYIKRPFKGEP